MSEENEKKNLDETQPLQDKDESAQSEQTAEPLGETAAIENQSFENTSGSEADIDVDAPEMHNELSEPAEDNGKEEKAEESEMMGDTGSQAQTIQTEDNALAEQQASSGVSLEKKEKPLTENGADNVQDNESGQVSNEVDEGSASHHGDSEKGTIKIIGVIALAVVIIAGIFAYKSGVFSGKGKGIEHPVAYAKDGALYIRNLDGSIAKATEELSDGGSYNYFYMATGVKVAEDGKNIFYADKVKMDSTFDLYYRSKDLKEDGNKGTLLSENVIDFRINNAGTAAVYLKDDGGKTGIYYNDTKGEKKIDSGVINQSNAYGISADGKYVTYVKIEGNTVNLYVADTALAGAEGETNGIEKIDSDVNQYVFADSNTKFFYLKADADGKTHDICEYVYGKGVTVVAEKVTALKGIKNNEGLIYQTLKEETINYADILEDDLAEAEVNLTEPVKDDYTDMEKYVDDYNDYSAKLRHDKIRKNLEGKSFTNYSEASFLYNGGVSSKVSDFVLESQALGDDGEYAIYSVPKGGTDIKVKMSELDSIDELEGKYQDAVYNSGKDCYFVKAGGEGVKIEAENITFGSGRLSKDGKKVYFTTDDNTLLVGTVSANGIENITEAAKNVKSADFNGSGSSIAYITDYNDTDMTGTLSYYNGAEAAEITKTASTFQFSEDGSVLYYIDEYNPAVFSGTLRSFVNGNAADIDTNVIYISETGNGHMIYLKDYDFTSGKGDLYYYDGKESKLVDSGISSIFLY